MMRMERSLATIRGMTLEQLRLAHPKLTYRRYDIESSGDILTITQEYLLEPDIVFRPTLTVPLPAPLPDPHGLDAFAFNLGMVEAMSYWKAAAPREFIIEAGMLSESASRFWEDLFLHGLGEFYYRNGIDFTTPDFLTIRSVSSRSAPVKLPAADVDGQAGLLLAGGGKDTAVSLGILKTSDLAVKTMVVNPTRAALDLIRLAGYDKPIIVKRRIDPLLLELNKRGYLNGHTPYSAFLAMAGSLVAYLYGYGNVIVSNEHSANEANVVYKGLEINHQYSKSFRFEQLFRQFVEDEGLGTAPYFSLLRPVNDLQIARMFSRYPEFFAAFRSCNVGQRDNRWCGACAKCAFTYLVLSPFIDREQLIVSFGADLYQNPDIIAHIRAETGLEPVKPFECVGTRDEAKLAVILTVGRYLDERREVPEGLLRIKSDLSLSDAEIGQLKNRVLTTWADTYNLPPEYVVLLRGAWDASAATRL